MNLIVDAPLCVCLCYCSMVLFDYLTCFALLLSCFVLLCFALYVWPCLALNITTNNIFITFSNLDNSIHDYFPNCCYRVIVEPQHWVHNQGKCLQRCGLRMKLESHISCSWECRKV